MLKIIDKLTGYKNSESFDNVKSFPFELSHSILKIKGSILTLLNSVKQNKIKYIKILKTSILQKDEDTPKEETRHFFDYLMTNMVYDVIKHADNTFLTNMYIKTYMHCLTDVIDNFNKYPYDLDDFNRMNYGIFVNDSMKYGGNCQIFSMIFEFVAFCSKNEYLKNLFVKLCSEQKFQKYYIELNNNKQELLKDVLFRKIKNSRLNLIFWIVAIDIMMQLNKINENAYVITNSLLNSGFIISNDKISLLNSVRKESELKTNCVFYVCENHCHVGFLTHTIVFDIDNMNKPSGISDFINRACEYYNFENTKLTTYYYNNTFIELF